MRQGIVVDLSPIPLHESGDEQQQGTLGLVEVGHHAFHDVVLVAWGDDDLRGTVQHLHVMPLHEALQFIDVLGVGKSLLQLTVERFGEICKTENVWVVTNKAYLDLVREQLPECSRSLRAILVRRTMPVLFLGSTGPAPVSVCILQAKWLQLPQSMRFFSLCQLIWCRSVVSV